ncbi:hypothetical protein DSO57_1010228 [Entomophthora muscae]|uniref:Uncharacterized protein n=1 Tax=Entomophthora muscae TaxID=34485 RepID=A0ACC2RXP6_9FUNG|nr:hypothetical protein DSO57_1010228 [Entomophthora muscae]
MVKKHTRELKKPLKDLDSAIAEIKGIDCKVKEKVKSVVLTGNKINKVSAKALMVKMPDTSEKSIECLLNVQKTVVEGLFLRPIIIQKADSTHHQGSD